VVAPSRPLRSCSARSLGEEPSGAGPPKRQTAGPGARGPLCDTQVTLVSATSVAAPRPMTINRAIALLLDQGRVQLRLRHFRDARLNRGPCRAPPDLC
jgi:hypothetical protein